MWLEWFIVAVIALVTHKWISVVVAARNEEDKKVRTK